ncbi:MAG: hypothetical protein KH431_10670 [Erysipelotrichaceae bacterium]|nr:hypothetical protein [Erysipelotrichaceae bacterium]
MDTAFLAGMEQLNRLFFITIGFVLMWFVAFAASKIASRNDKTYGANPAVLFSSIMAILFGVITIFYGLFFAVT